MLPQSWLQKVLLPKCSMVGFVRWGHIYARKIELIGGKKVAWHTTEILWTRYVRNWPTKWFVLQYMDQHSPSTPLNSHPLQKNSKTSSISSSGLYTPYPRKISILEANYILEKSHPHGGTRNVKSWCTHAVLHSHASHSLRPNVWIPTISSSRKNNN